MPSLRYFQRPRMNLPWFCLARTPPKTLWIRMDSTSTSQCTVNSGSQILSFWRRSRIRFSLKVSRLIVSFILCVCLFCHCLISLTITITQDFTQPVSQPVYTWMFFVSFLTSVQQGWMLLLSVWTYFSQEQSEGQQFSFFYSRLLISMTLRTVLFFMMTTLFLRGVSSKGEED